MRLMLWVSAVLIIVAGSTVVEGMNPDATAAAGASMSPTWHIRATFPFPQGASGDGAFGSVSCPVRTTCFAVGGSEWLYETRASGSTWNDVPGQLPSSVSGSGASSISCTSATFCEAVGYTSVLKFNGSTWTSQSLPSALLDRPGFGGTATTYLTSVSCVSDSFCEAVGDSIGSPHLPGTGFALGYNGHDWTLQKLPAGGVSPPSGVSCAAENFCEMTVGSSFLISQPPIVALVFDGTSWTDQSVPPNVGTLSGVSCTSASSCVAVGANMSGGDIAVAFNGRTWTDQPVPPRVATLSGVSCTSASSCVAVGDNASPVGAAATEIVRGVALELNEGAWISQAVPPGVGQLSGVSCTAGGFCEAVGADLSGTYGAVLVFDGGAWTVQGLPSPLSTLSGVSCISARFCIAVGQKLWDTAGAVLGFDGREWAAQHLPAGVFGLSSVTCVSATFCETVGSTWPGEPAALGFNGRIWAFEPLPTGSYSLSSVSCTSARFCIAVGPNLSGISAVAVRFDGRRWAGQRLPSGIRSLSGVSCVSERFCEAVGLANDGIPEMGIAIAFDGRHWKSQNLTASHLAGVSCVSTAFCEAVRSSWSSTFATVRFNGRQWSGQSTLSEVVNLTGGSCGSAQLCEVIGSALPSTPTALDYNGREWSNQSLPIAVTNLSGVSCTQTNFCTAVGSQADGVLILELQLPAVTSPRSSASSGMFPIAAGVISFALLAGFGLLRQRRYPPDWPLATGEE